MKKFIYGILFVLFIQKVDRKLGAIYEESEILQSIVKHSARWIMDTTVDITVKKLDDMLGEPKASEKAKTDYHSYSNNQEKN